MILTAFFDPKVGLDAEAASAREIEKLPAKIGQLTIENDPDQVGHKPFRQKVRQMRGFSQAIEGDGVAKMGLGGIISKG